MPQKTIVTLNRKRFCLTLDQLFPRHKFIIGLPIIGTYYSFGKSFNLFPEFLSSFSSPVANFAVDEPVPISINSNPDPTVVFFCPIYVCISSNSIISIPCGFLNSSSFSPKLFIQLKTATWLTSKKRPIDLKPKPSKYKNKASLLSLLGFPVCSTVNRYAQSLQRYLCLDLTMPSLRKFLLLHFGQLSITILFIPHCRGTPCNFLILRSIYFENFNRGDYACLPARQGFFTVEWHIFISHHIVNFFHL